MMYENIDFNSIDLTQEPPVSEPERQYYFIAKCKQYVKEQEELAGHPLTADVVTFGCQMNARDSEKLSGILEQVGYTLSDSEEADFVIYNTCTVRDNANQRVYGRLGFCNSMKRKNPHKKIALCGCMMQEQNVIDKLQKSYRFIDLIFGTHNIFKFAELLCRMFESSGMVIDIWKDSDQIVEDLPVERKYPFKSGINIMFGCNNFCTYCIVPYVRGREKSRRPKEILQEIEKLADDGVVEIMLLGQNVNSYGKNLEDEISFAQLLQEVEKIDKIKRIRFMTSHPKDLSDELIEVMKNSDKICRHLHLPLQSGSTKILKAMNRRYTKEQYLELAAKIRREIPNAAIRTSLIAGFPGESESDFEELCDFVREVRFERLGVFAYSREEDTPAYGFDNQIDEDEKERRRDLIMMIQSEIAEEQNAKKINSVVRVLVEGKDEIIKSFYGRTYADSEEIDGKVFFKSDRNPLPGEFVNVKVEQTMEYDLFGTECE